MFIRDGASYLPTNRARGPWNPEFLHGGPVAALFAHAFETRGGDADFILSRMTVDLMQAVPVAPLSVRVETARANRRTRYLDAQISADGATVARASAMLLQRNGDQRGASTLPLRDPLPHWTDLAPESWGLLSPRALFHNGIEVRNVHPPYSGMAMRTWACVPYELLPGRALTPTERVATLSDFGSGIGIMSQPSPEHAFINGDITLYLHREPQGEWICLESAGRGDWAGVATSNVNLHDALGLFGHVSVAGIANRWSSKPGFQK